MKSQTIESIHSERWCVFVYVCVYRCAIEEIAHEPKRYTKSKSLPYLVV